MAQWYFQSIQVSQWLVMRRASRKLIGTIVCSLLVLPLLAASSNADSPVATVTLGMVNKSGSSVVPLLLAQDAELQKKHKIKVETKVYPSVPAVWTALDAGEFHAMTGSPSGFSARALRGVPLRIIATYAISSPLIIGKTDIKSAEDLKGKRLTVVNGGLWSLNAALIAEKFKLTANKDYDVIVGPSLLAGITQVLAGTANFAWGWETDTTLALKRYPDLKVSLSLNALRDPGEESHIQVYAAHSTLSPEVEARLVSALSEIADRIQKDPDLADKMFSDLSGVDKGIYSDAVRSGRYKVTVRPLTDQDADAIAKDLRRTSPNEAALPRVFLKR
jgi:ABC-type nitrate/sulfonate/bicarbonate transport system substrate-binding protein